MLNVNIPTQQIIIHRHLLPACSNYIELLMLLALTPGFVTCLPNVIWNLVCDWWNGLGLVCDWWNGLGLVCDW